MSPGGIEARAPRRPAGALRASAALLRLARDERGFTLIELLWGAVLAVFVFAGITAFMIVSLNQGNDAASRANSTTQAQAGLNQLTRDLSNAVGSPQAVTLSQNATTTTLNFEIPNPSSSDAAEQVTWTCYSISLSTSNAGTCTRQVGGSSAPVFEEMSGIQSVTLSPSGCTPSSPCSGTSATDPTYVGISLSVEVVSQNGLATIPGTTTPTVATVRGTSPIVLNAGVDLRNQ